MHLPVSRRNHAGFFLPIAACILAAAPVHASALEATSADGRYRIATDDAAGELVVYPGSGTRELRRIPLVDRNRRDGPPRVDHRPAAPAELPRRVRGAARGVGAPLLGEDRARLRRPGARLPHGRRHRGSGAPSGPAHPAGRPPAPAHPGRAADPRRVGRPGPARQAERPESRRAPHRGAGRCARCAGRGGTGGGSRTRRFPGRRPRREVRPGAQDREGPGGGGGEPRRGGHRLGPGHGERDRTRGPLPRGRGQPARPHPLRAGRVDRGFAHALRPRQLQHPRPRGQPRPDDGGRHPPARELPRGKLLQRVAQRARHRPAPAGGDRARALVGHPRLRRARRRGGLHHPRSFLVPRGRQVRRRRGVRHPCRRGPQLRRRRRPVPGRGYHPASPGRGAHGRPGSREHGQRGRHGRGAHASPIRRTRAPRPSSPSG